MSALPQWVHVFATFGRGGPQVRALQLMQHCGSGMAHVVIAMDGCVDALTVAQRMGVTVQVQAPPKTRSLWGALRAWRAQWREQRPELVLTYNWGAIEAACGARLAGRPLVHHEDGFLPAEAQRRHLRRNLLRRIALRRVPVIVPSAGLLAIAQREWGMQRVQHLVNGVDLAHFAPRAERRPASDQPLVLGAVGGLRPEKDIATLLAALATVPAVQLRIVGDGPLRAALRARAAELGLSDRVQWAGACADTAAEYQRMDVMVISSCTEQMPLVLLEAMASGLPVVATDVGDIARVLPACARPFVVQKQSPNELARALREVVASAELRAQLSAANRARAEQCYSAPVCLERFAALYRATAHGRLLA